MKETEEKLSMFGTESTMTKEKSNLFGGKQVIHLKSNLMIEMAKLVRKLYQANLTSKYTKLFTSQS